MKTKKLVLEDLRNINSLPDGAFRVKKIINSVEFKIDQLLNPSTVERLINSRAIAWTVEIVKKS